MSNKRLIPMNVNHGGMKDLSDALYLIAREIETGFLAMDATPGGITRERDLMEMALDYAINGGDFAIETTTFE